VDLQNRVQGVVIAAQERRQLERLDTVVQRLDGPDQVASDLLPFAAQFEKRLGVLDESPQLAGGVDVQLEPRPPLLKGLRELRVAPDLGLGQLFFELAESDALGLDIKETSARTRPSRRALAVVRPVPRDRRR
jgi:hypothetical protein